VSPQQRAQILYLYRVEGVSIALIAAMTELSRATVREVVRQACLPDAAAPRQRMRPSSKGHIERRHSFVRAELLRRLRKGAP